MENDSKIHNASPEIIQPGEAAPPILWKQWLITASSVYLLLLTADWALNYFLPMHLFSREIAILFMVLIVVTSMVFVVIPLSTKYLGNWMRRK